MANSMDPDQTAPIGAVCSGSTLFASIGAVCSGSMLFASILNLLGNYLQQTTSAGDIFRCIFLGISAKYTLTCTVNLKNHEFLSKRCFYFPGHFLRKQH